MADSDKKTSSGSERDLWLALSDERLIQDCTLDFFKASGNGGQKRNKTSSAVRLIHNPSGLAVTSAGTRSQHQNRADALKKLRKTIALNIRSDVLHIPDFMEMSTSNPDFPKWIASVFDALNMADFSIGDAALALNVSSAKLQKLLRRDPQLWQELNSFRQKKGLPPLH